MTTFEEPRDTVSFVEAARGAADVEGDLVISLARTDTEVLLMTAPAVVDAPSVDVVTVVGANRTLRAVTPTRLFDLRRVGASVHLEGLHLIEGVSPSLLHESMEDRGGCVVVYAGATARIADTTFTRCTAGRGGGVGIQPGGFLVLERALFRACTAAWTGGGIDGAGSEVVVRRSTFRDIFSGAGGGALTMFDGVEVSSPGLVLEGSVVERCTSKFGGAFLSPPNGFLLVTGTVFANLSSINYGGAIVTYGGTVTSLAAATFRGCHCVGSGGALALTDSLDTFLRPGTVSALRVTDGTRITNCAADGSGGGIFSFLTHPVIIDGASVFEGCAAGRAGGAIFHVGDVHFEGASAIRRCVAGDNGGGLYLGFRRQRCVIRGGAALTHNVAVGGHGGAVLLPKESALVVDNAIFAHNAALGGVGGAIATAGGDIWLMVGSVLEGNAAFAGGAIAFVASFDENGAPSGEAGMTGAASSSSSSSTTPMGRLFASGTTCAFVSLELDLTGVDDFLDFTTSYAAIRDGATGAVADALGDLMQIPAPAGTTTTRSFCLPLNRTYDLDLSTIDGQARWVGAVARLFGPVVKDQEEAASSSSSSSSSPPLSSSEATASELLSEAARRGSGGYVDYAVPNTLDWRRRYVVNHRFTLADIVGAPPSFVANVAADRGGAVSLERADAYVADADLTQNRALADSNTGGAFYLAYSTRLVADDVRFVSNSAPNGQGGAIRGSGDCAITLRRAATSNNTAAKSGGFGDFEEAATVVVQDSTFHGNAVLGGQGDNGQGGGALNFDGVGSATIADSVFSANAVLASGDGGALASRHSNIDLRRTVFTENFVTDGNGGAVATADGAVTWTNELDQKDCTPTRVLVDYSVTTNKCGQFSPEILHCDGNPSRCELNQEATNVYVPANRTDLLTDQCAGCACPWDFHKYFVVRNGVTGEAVPVLNALRGAPDTRGTGAAGSIYTHDLCLEGGNFTIQAFDEFDQGWWGAALSVHVANKEEAGGFVEYGMPAWSGSVSSTVGFVVPRAGGGRVGRKANRVEGNVAARGGGGGVFWSWTAAAGAAGEPVGLGRNGTSGALVEGSNVAAYGPDTATNAVELDVGTIGAGLGAHIRVAVRDYYGTVVTTALSTLLIASDIPASNKIIQGGAVFYDEFVAVAEDGFTDDHLGGGATSPRAAVEAPLVTRFVVQALNLETRHAISVACAAGYRRDDAVSCSACSTDEYWTVSRGAGECRECEDGMECGRGTTLEDRLLPNLAAKKNWWRKSYQSKRFYPCELTQACKKGHFVDRAACADGYEGPTCGACKKAYYLEKTSARCLKCSGSSKVVVVVVFVVIVIAVLAALALAYMVTVYIATDRVLCASRALWSPNLFPRLAILYVTIQIMVSVEATFEIRFPEPFWSLLRFLDVVNFDVRLLPLQCVNSYSYYEELLTATVMPVGLILVFWIVGPVHERWCAGAGDTVLQRLSRLVWYRFSILTVCFIAYPITSAIIFEVFRKCRDFQHAWRGGYLPADLHLRCGTATHGIYVIYGLLMFTIVTLGLPVALSVVLFAHRDRINPRGCVDVDAAVRARSADSVLAKTGLIHVVQAYKPRCMYLPAFELLRRVTHVGLISFFTDGPLRAFVGLGLALAYLAAMREVKPYVNHNTNLFAYGLAWFTFFIYLAGFLVSTRPFGFDDAVLGVVLLFATVLTLFATVAIGRRDRTEALYTAIKMHELEFRQEEADADIAALIGAKHALRNKYERDQVHREGQAQTAQIVLTPRSSFTAGDGDRPPATAAAAPPVVVVDGDDDGAHDFEAVINDARADDTYRTAPKKKRSKTKKRVRMFTRRSVSTLFRASPPPPPSFVQDAGDYEDDGDESEAPMTPIAPPTPFKWRYGEALMASASTQQETRLRPTQQKAAAMGDDGAKVEKLKAEVTRVRQVWRNQRRNQDRPSTVSSVAADLVTEVACRPLLSVLRSQPKVVDLVSFTEAKYPCYVIPLTKLRAYDRLLAHEDALRQGDLEMLRAMSTSPNSARSYFISQNWETFGIHPHPDNKRNTKLNWLKHLPAHLGLTHFGKGDELWIWFDWVSIPQRHPEQQASAIASLCCYTQLCTRVLALVRDKTEWARLYGEDLRDDCPPNTPVAGALSTYLSRGWCRLELIAALTPKKYPTGNWRHGPRSMLIRYHHNPDDAGIGPPLTADQLLDPTKGTFTVELDRFVIQPVLMCIASRFDEYEASGSHVWDGTIDVTKRPDFLHFDYHNRSDDDGDGDDDDDSVSVHDQTPETAFRELSEPDGDDAA